MIELFVVGTAVIPSEAGGGLPKPFLVLPGNDEPVAETDPDAQKGE